MAERLTHCVSASRPWGSWCCRRNPWHSGGGPAPSPPATCSQPGPSPGPQALPWSPVTGAGLRSLPLIPPPKRARAWGHGPPNGNAGARGGLTSTRAGGGGGGAGGGGGDGGAGAGGGGAVSVVSSAPLQPMEIIGIWRREGAHVQRRGKKREGERG